MNTATLVFLTASGALGTPSADAHKTLAHWGRERSLTLAPPNRATRPPIPTNDDVVQKVEEALEKAREGLVTEDHEGTERILVSAERLLFEHPECLQGPWLYAEILRTRAPLHLRKKPSRPDLALEALALADGIAGPRAQAAGELPRPTRSENGTARLELDRSLGSTLLLNGTAIDAGPVEVARGRHHVAVAEQGMWVWAGFVSFSEGAIVHIDPGPYPRCSERELQDVRTFVDVGGVRHTATSGVQCATWVVAVETTPQSVDVALCEGKRCGAFERIRWGPSPAKTAKPQPKGTSLWITATVVGLSSFAAAGLSLYALGVFERREPDPQWRSGGFRVE